MEVILGSPSGETRKLFSPGESSSAIDLLTAHLQPQSPGTHIYLRVGGRADSRLIVILTNTETSRQRAPPGRALVTEQSRPLPALPVPGAGEGPGQGGLDGGPEGLCPVPPGVAGGSR